MFEVFDHTADLGLRVQAVNLPELFTEAGRALLSVIVSNPDSVQARDEVSVRVVQEDTEYLFFDWLNELLFLFESKRFLASQFDVRLNEIGLSANVRGEIRDPSRHVLAHEVKAVTYHGLMVERS